MKRMRKHWWIVAISLMSLGLIFFAIGFAAVGFDFWGLETVKCELNEYVIEEDFEKILIQCKTADVEIKVSEDGRCRVVCSEYKNEKHVVGVEGQTLSVKYDDTRKWYEYLTFSLHSPCITVYLPAGEYADINVCLTTGDVLMEEGLYFVNSSVSSTTGSIVCHASASESLKLKTGMGDILLEDASLGDACLSVRTGKIKVKNVRCGSISTSGTTGGVTMCDTVASGKMEIRQVTGDVSLSACDASEITIRTTTGDVEGTLLSEKDFHASATTGTVRVPDTKMGGRCEIKTTTGDIQIELCERG